MFTQRERADKLYELENDLAHVVVRSLDPSWKSCLEQQSRQELSFVAELLALNPKQERRYKVRAQCIHMYMTNLGEASVLQRRIQVLKNLKMCFTRQKKGLSKIEDLYEASILSILKHIARVMGFMQPTDVMNRFDTLRFLFNNGMKEQEELHEKYSRINEEHLHLITRLGKKNLLLNNERFTLHDHLYDLEKETAELSNQLNESLKWSNESNRMTFQITSMIQNLHDRVTTGRGWESHATTPIDQLQEIQVRLNTLKEAVDAMMFRTPTRQSSMTVDQSAKRSEGNRSSDQNTSARRSKSKNNNRLRTSIVQSSCSSSVTTTGITTTSTARKPSSLSSNASVPGDNYNNLMKGSYERKRRDRHANLEKTSTRDVIDGCMLRGDGGLSELGHDVALGASARTFTTAKLPPLFSR